DNHADSIGVYRSGVAADGDAQSDPNASFGNHRAGTEVVELGVTRTSAISNVTINFVAGANGTGNGTLTASGDDELKWTPPGGTQGAAVTILNGETKILEGGAGEPSKYIKVTRTSASNLSGTETD